MKRLLMAVTLALLAAGSHGQDELETHMQALWYLASPGTSTCAQTPDDLVSFYPAEGTAIDVAGIYSGTPIGDAGYATGLVNQAFSFDGVGDYVYLASAPSATTFTIEAWVYLIGDHPNYASIYAGLQQGFWLANRRLDWWDGGDLFIGDTPIPPDEWHHIAVSYDGGSGSFVGYVDGVNDGMSSFMGASLPVPAYLGGDPFGEDLTGLIDELSVYNRVLSESEIQGIFAAGGEGKCLMFIGHFETGDASRWSGTVP